MIDPDMERQELERQNRKPMNLNFLRSKMRIGSIKTPLNYKKKEAAIQERDVPESKKARAKEVRKYKASKICGVHAPSWENGTKFTEEVLFRPTHNNLRRDRKKGFEYNYRAEVLHESVPDVHSKGNKFSLRHSKSGQMMIPAKHMTLNLSEARHADSDFTSSAQFHHDQVVHDRLMSGHLPRHVEVPVHPHLHQKADWNATSPSIDYRTLTDNLNEKTAKSLRNTRMWSADMSKKMDKRVKSKRVYLTPQEQQTEVTRKVRELKSSGSFRQSLKPLRDDPTAEINKVTKQSYENRYAIELSRYTSSNHHSGVWELNKQEGRYMWSDTGSFNYHSRGDIVTVTKLDQSNFEGPTLPMEVFSNASKRINLIE